MIAWSNIPGLTTLELQMETRSRKDDSAEIFLLPTDLAEIRQEVSCPICLDVMQNVMVTRCLHRYCKECINKHLRQVDQKRECPSCRIHLTTNRSLRKDDAMDAVIELFFPRNTTRRNGDNVSTEKTAIMDAARRSHRERVRIMQDKQRTRREHQSLLISKDAEAKEAEIKIKNEKQNLLASTYPTSHKTIQASSSSAGNHYIQPIQPFGDAPAASDGKECSDSRIVWAEMKSPEESESFIQRTVHNETSASEESSEFTALETIYWSVVSSTNSTSSSAAVNTTSTSTSGGKKSELSTSSNLSNNVTEKECSTVAASYPKSTEERRLTSEGVHSGKNLHENSPYEKNSERENKNKNGVGDGSRSSPQKTVVDAVRIFC